MQTINNNDTISINTALFSLKKDIDNNKVKGEKGDPGKQGPQGQQGPKGEKGDQGKSIPLIDNIDLYNNYTIDQIYNYIETGYAVRVTEKPIGLEIDDLFSFITEKVTDKPSSLIFCKYIGYAVGVENIVITGISTIGEQGEQGIQGVQGEKGYSIIRAIRNDFNDKPFAEWLNFSKERIPWFCENPQDFRKGDYIYIEGRVTDRNFAPIFFIGLVDEINSDNRVVTLSGVISTIGEKGDTGVGGETAYRLVRESDNVTYVEYSNGTKVYGGDFYIKEGRLLLESAGIVSSFGSTNASWCHILTEAPKFYFDKSVAINGTIERYSSRFLEIIGGANLSDNVTVNGSGKYIYSAGGNVYAQVQLVSRGTPSNDGANSVSIGGCIAGTSAYRRDIKVVSNGELRRIITNLPQWP